jgi:hypothetical protein
MGGCGKYNFHRVLNPARFTCNIFSTMRSFFYPVAVLVLLLTGCGQKETGLQKLCREIRNAPQTPFPAGHDEKWKLIKKMESVHDPAVPDSLQSIFGSIDTSISGYNEYYHPILNRLAQPDSRKSLKILAEIYRDNYISDPGCSQVLTNMILLDEKVQISMAKAYLTKNGRVDYSNAVQHIDVMFPDLTRILGKRPFTDRPVLDLLKIGIAEKKLTKENLAGSQEDLVRYYDYLKLVRDSLARSPANGFSYTGYYESHIGDLLEVLKVFDHTDKLDRIFAETGENKK